MFARFVFKQFSGMSRSSIFGARASPSAPATVPFIPQASEAGISALSTILLGAAVRPGNAIPGNHGIRRYIVTRTLSSGASNNQGASLEAKMATQYNDTKEYFDNWTRSGNIFIWGYGLFVLLWLYNPEKLRVVG